MLQRTRNYAKDYIQSSDNGALQYVGKHYCFSLGEPALSRVKRLHAQMLLAAAALYIGIGLLDSVAFGGGGAPAAVSVVLPYVGLLFPLGLACGRAALLAKTQRPLEFAEYDRYLLRQKGVLIVALALAGCLVLGLAALLLILALRAKTDLLRDMGSLAAAALCWGCIYIAYKQYAILAKNVLPSDFIDNS